jgi:hypothetical protein
MRSVYFYQRRRGVVHDGVWNGYLFQSHTSSKN